MRIAIVHNFYRSTSPSGENTAVLEQIRALEEHGHDVRLFSERNDEISNNYLDLLEHAWTVATGISYRLRLSKEIPDFKPEIVHTHNTFPQIGTSWLKDISCPVVSTLHNFRTFCASGLLTRNNQDCLLCPEKSSLNSIKFACYRNSKIQTFPLAVATRAHGTYNQLIRRADALVVLSEYSETVHRRYFGERKTIVKVPNFSPFEVPDDYQTQARGNWVFVGRLSPEKGIMELLENWPTDRKLDVYGSGGLQDEVTSVIRSKPNIRFLGNLDRSSVGRVLSNSRGLVFPSTCRENLPMIYVEALSLGTPVVAYAKNSVADLVIQQSAGTVFSTWANLGEALDELEREPLRFSENAVSAAKTQYSKESWYERMSEVYEVASRNFSKL